MCPCVGVHRRISLMNLSLLLQQFPAYFVCLTWMVYEMGGRWLYSCCFVGYFSQDLFIQHTASLCSSHVTFSPNILFGYKWCNHTVVLKLLRVGRIPILFYQRVKLSWLGCRIHWLHLCRGVRLLNECPRYDTKQSDGKASVMQEVWGMQSILHCYYFQVYSSLEW